MNIEFANDFLEQEEAEETGCNCHAMREEYGPLDR
jgi:hypothetical protein